MLEAGTWQVAGGRRLQVGTRVTGATVGVRVSNVWAGVTFSESFSSAPVVLSQVQSNNDPHWVKTRQRNASTVGFDVALEEEEASDTAHGTETIGWLATLACPQGERRGRAPGTTIALRLFKHQQP